MFTWKFIFLIVIIKIISLILTNYYTKKHPNSIDINTEAEHRICITPIVKNFMFCWIKFTVEMINYSKSIILKYPEQDKYYTELEKTKNELINLFGQIHTNSTSDFESLINNQLLIKTDLCNSILNDNKTEINEYEQELVENTNELINLFIKIKQDKESDNKLQQTMKTHTQTYIKSVKFIKNATNDKFAKELIFGSIDTVKLLFI